MLFLSDIWVSFKVFWTLSFPTQTSPQPRKYAHAEIIFETCRMGYVQIQIKL